MKECGVLVERGLLAHTTDDVDAGLTHREAEPQIGHHGHDHRVVSQFAARLQVIGDDRNDVITVDDAARVIDSDQAVGVAIERDADICTMFHDGSGNERRSGRAAPIVDVAAVGRVRHHGDVGPGGAEHLGSDLVRSAVRGIDHHPHPVEPKPFEEPDDVVAIRLVISRRVDDRTGDAGER